MNPCQNCGRPYKPLRRGLCQACAVYRRRFSKPRPYLNDGRKEGGGLRGAAHPAWKGAAASTTSKRARAQRRYKKLGPCRECGAKTTERHHLDGDTGNNEPGNIAVLCRRCHMATDGRLTAFMAMRNTRTVAPKPCTNCGRPSKPLRKGLCHPCNEYQRRTGSARPYVNDGRRKLLE